MNNSEVKPFKIRQSILYPGGNKPKGAPDFYTIEVIEHSAYQSLQKENEFLKARVGVLERSLRSGVEYLKSCGYEDQWEPEYQMLQDFEKALKEGLDGK